MLTLQDEKGTIVKTSIGRKPNLESSSKWFAVTKYIEEEAIRFYYIKGNGAHFYFYYQGKWYAMLKGSIFNEMVTSRYTIVK